MWSQSHVWQANVEVSHSKLTPDLAYTIRYIHKEPSMPVPAIYPRPREVKLFRNNRSQAVRIPVEFELPGDRVLISS